MICMKQCCCTQVLSLLALLVQKVQILMQKELQSVCSRTHLHCKRYRRRLKQVPYAYYYVSFAYY